MHLKPKDARFCQTHEIPVENLKLERRSGKEWRAHPTHKWTDVETAVLRHFQLRRGAHVDYRGALVRLLAARPHKRRKAGLTSNTPQADNCFDGFSVFWEPDDVWAYRELIEDKVLDWNHAETVLKKLHENQISPLPFTPGARFSREWFSGDFGPIASTFRANWDRFHPALLDMFDYTFPVKYVAKEHEINEMGSKLGFGLGLSLISGVLASKLRGETADQSLRELIEEQWHFDWSHRGQNREVKNFDAWRAKHPELYEMIHDLARLEPNWLDVKSLYAEGTHGWIDLFLFLPDDARLAVEVKAPGDTFTKTQRIYLPRLRDAGWEPRVIVAEPME